MQHIPTTATALRKIKDAAKKLKVISDLTLAQAQDRAAQDAGYEHYHHAIRCARNTLAPVEPQARLTSLGLLRFWLLPPEYRVVGSGRRTEGRFEFDGDADLLDAVTEEHDDYRDSHGLYFDDIDDDESLSPDDTTALNLFLSHSKALTEKEPAFLDGYASQVGTLFFLKRYDEAIGVGQPIFDAACALIPADFKGLISYNELSNRPFHRLAANLSLAYIESGNVSAGHTIARQMLKWWPNDNIGFRFHLG